MSKRGRGMGRLKTQTRNDTAHSRARIRRHVFQVSFESSVPTVVYVDISVGVPKVVCMRSSLELFSEFSVDALELWSYKQMVQILEHRQLP